MPEFPLTLNYDHEQHIGWVKLDDSKLIEASEGALMVLAPEGTLEDGKFTLTGFGLVAANRLIGPDEYEKLGLRR